MASEGFLNVWLLGGVFIVNGVTGTRQNCPTDLPVCRVDGETVRNPAYIRTATGRPLVAEVFIRFSFDCRYGGVLICAGFRQNHAIKQMFDQLNDAGLVAPDPGIIRAIVSHNDT